MPENRVIIAQQRLLQKMVIKSIKKMESTISFSVGQPNQAALVTVSKNNPNYCSIDFYIDSNNMVEEEKYNDFLHKTNQDGCNSFVVTNTGHILDTEC